MIYSHVHQLRTNGINRTNEFLSLLEIQGCGFSSKEETGVIKSQYWPKIYKGHSECMWNIAVHAEKKLTLKFTHFDLEAGDMLTSKCYDNVMLYDINGLTNVLNKKHGRSFLAP